MGEIDIRSFDDTRVGDALPAASAALLGGTPDWATLVERYVEGWAGRGARIARLNGEQDGDRPVDDLARVAGRIYARHLDDSRDIDLKIVGCTRGGARLVDMVRVRLR